MSDNPKDRRGGEAAGGAGQVHGRAEDAQPDVRALAELAVQADFLQTILDHADICIYAKDVDLRYIYVNRATATLFGKEIGDIVGKTDEEAYGAWADHAFGDADRFVLQHRQRVQREEHLVDHEGRARTVLTTKVPLLDAEGALHGIVGQSSDITELSQARNRLQRLVLLDDLTGIASRRALLQAGETALAHACRHSEALTVIVFDIDHFKVVNDEHGHQAGDRVLQGVTHTCNSLIRASDTFGRIGGEEFAILLLGMRATEGRNLAERLRSAIMDDWHDGADGTRVQVTASFGVAELRPDSHEALLDLLARADQALYDAKLQGRNRVVVADLSD